MGSDHPPTTMPNHAHNHAHHRRRAEEALPGYIEVQPMVYCGLFPTDSDKYQVRALGGLGVPLLRPMLGARRQRAWHSVQRRCIRRAAIYRLKRA